MKKYTPEQSRKLFVRHLYRNVLLGISLIFLSLAIGMAGYRFFEHMSWIDAYENAAMILSGMGPAVEMKTTLGKLFAGTYALFSGIVFLVIIAIVFVPIIHRFFLKFHIEDKK